jgi:hypothetical protein
MNCLFIDKTREKIMPFKAIAYMDMVFVGGDRGKYDMMTGVILIKNRFGCHKFDLTMEQCLLLMAEGEELNTSFTPSPTA